MKVIKLNEKQKKELKGCKDEFAKAACIKDSADEKFHRANRAFWKKIVEICPETKWEEGLKFNSIDWSVEYHC